MEKIRILGIAPYEGMKSLLIRTAAEQFPQIELNVVVGDLQKGADMAKNNFHADYDVIISRGGTAQLLRSMAPLPVIDIKITEYDLLRALRLAENFSAKHAIVGFSNITENARILSDLMAIPVKAFTISHAAQVADALTSVAAEGFEAIICDMVATTTAKQMGLNAILITSGPEAVSAAFNDALTLCGNMKRLQAENHFFREIIAAQSTETVVFDQNKNLYFSTMNQENSSPVLEMLENEIDNCSDQSPSRMIKSLGGTLYTIKARKFSVNGKPYTTFYISRSKSPLSSSRFGIAYRTCQEALKSFHDAFYSITGALSSLEHDISVSNRSFQPIMLLGEDGVGKEQVATLLYAKGPLSHHPLITINCALLNEKTWEYLLESHNSPFAQSDSTIYISGLAALSRDDRSRLLAALKGMEVARRNRMILSCICDFGETLPDAAREFLDALCCLKIQLPPLREQKERIPAMISLYLNQLNAAQDRIIAGMDSAGVAMMQRFSWPHNYTQIKRVLQELSSVTDTPVITADSVRRVLGLECASPVAGTASGFYSPNRFDLNRTLEEMQADIIHRVVEECGGNQTTAAKRLGISRTTLWRFLSR